MLGRLSRDLPVTLVLVIDQAEEMFTLARSPVEEWGRDRVLEMIRQVGDGRGDFKLIVSLRTEYYGRLVSALRRGLAEADGVREYLLTDLDVPAMVEVIRRPTLREHLPHAAEVPFEKYQRVRLRRRRARGDRPPGGPPRPHRRRRAALAGHLRPALRARDGPRRPPGHRRRPSPDRRLRRRARAGTPSDRSGAALPELKSDRERFQVLLTRLTLSQVDGTLTTALLREDDLRRLWDGREPFDALLPRACDLRLLRTTTHRLESGSEERLVSLGHDALAKVAQPWKQELERRAERRKWRIRWAVAAAAAVLFGGLSLVALHQATRAVQAQREARANEAKAKQSAKEAIRESEEAEQQRSQAKKAQQVALTNEATAKVSEAKASDSAAEARAVLGFFENHVLSAARPEGLEGGLGWDVTLRKAIDAAEPKIAGEFKGRAAVEASIRHVLGNTYRHLGEPPLAIREHERTRTPKSPAGPGPPRHPHQPELPRNSLPGRREARPGDPST